MPSALLPLCPSYGYFDTTSSSFDHRLPISELRTCPSLSSSSSTSSPSPRPSTPSYSVSSSTCSKKKYDPVYFEVDARRKRLEEDSVACASRPSTSSDSSTSSDDGDWKPSSSKPSEVMVLSEKELARKERRKAVNRASAAAFRLRKKVLLEKQKAVLEEKDTIASVLREQAMTMLKENERLKAQLREIWR